MGWFKNRGLNAAWVFSGSVAGGGLRFALQEGVLFWFGLAWLPVCTMLINAVASAGLGWVIACQPHSRDERYQAVENRFYRLFFGTGFCGGFSSFSLFTIDWLELVNQPLVAFAYIMGSIFAALAGFRLASRLG
jgi:CrcB protein